MYYQNVLSYRVDSSKPSTLRIQQATFDDNTTSAGCGVVVYTFFLNLRIYFTRTFKLKFPKFLS